MAEKHLERIFHSPNTGEERACVAALKRKANVELEKYHQNLSEWIKFKYPITQGMLPLCVLLWGKDGAFWVGQILNISYGFNSYF